jgi:hypothetical protein
MPPAFDAAALRASPHAELECRACHADLAAVKDFPRPDKLKPVECGSCHGVPIAVTVAWTLASCNTAPSKGAALVPESEQVVSADLKELYMAAGAAAPQSVAQQKEIRRLARQ